MLENGTILNARKLCPAIALEVAQPELPQTVPVPVTPPTPTDPPAPANNHQDEHPRRSGATIGIVAILIFYIIIFLVGIIASKIQSKKALAQDAEAETTVTAAKSIGYFVSLFTITATWVDGGYINSTAEIVFIQGLVWCLPPIGFSLSLIISGLLFAKPFREAGYLTMLEPFQTKYGPWIGALAYIPSFFGDLLWTAAILRALGDTISVILSFNISACVIISACVAIGYTLFGGLFSVAYTDVVQLISVLFGLAISVPFVWNNKHTRLNNPDMQLQNVGQNRFSFGRVKPSEIGVYIDLICLVVFGGIPWQVYFQRVIGAKSLRVAQVSSIVAGPCCFLLAIPSILIGYAARFVDWRAVGVDPEMVSNSSSMVVPLALQYLTPTWVTFFGLGAVAGAVMSSTDSAMLSASTQFAFNIYGVLFRPRASRKEKTWALRASIVVFGAVACLISLKSDKIYPLFFMCADLVYVILFPQLTCVIFVKFVNKFGFLAGLIVSTFLRVGSGEESLGFPAFLKFPGYHNGTQVFPYRTFAAIVNFLATFGVSMLANRLQAKELFQKSFRTVRPYSNSGRVEDNKMTHF